MSEFKRLLIADDDLEMRSWLRAVLACRGAEVSEVESGAELLRALSEDGPFDLVVTDVRMSWASGVQALAMARTAGMHTPFVVITAYADDAVRTAADALGAALLEKPFTIEELLDTAQGLVARRQQREAAAG
jgi:DNA-binding NtrC family response regulator